MTAREGCLKLLDGAQSDFSDCADLKSLLPYFLGSLKTLALVVVLQFPEKIRQRGVLLFIFFLWIVFLRWIAASNGKCEEYLREGGMDFLVAFS